jgi:AcrR family transcriptional regulator
MPKTRSLDRDRIADAALELVEQHGLEALTMRRLGGRLGVEGMALYTYVQSKDELLDAVAERVLEGLAREFDRSTSWQERIRRGTLAWAELQERFPRAFPLVFRGSLRTDAVRLLTEELLDALRSAGLDPQATALAYQTVITLVDAALLGRSSWTDEQLEAAWLAGAAVVDVERFPRFGEVAPFAARLTWRQILDSGLDLLLTGLERRLED